MLVGHPKDRDDGGNVILEFLGPHRQGDPRAINLARQELWSDGQSSARGFEDGFLGRPENCAVQRSLGRVQPIKHRLFTRVKRDGIDVDVGDTSDALKVNPHHSSGSERNGRQVFTSAETDDRR
jgi:hypothetical protein